MKRFSNPYRRLRRWQTARLLRRALRDWNSDASWQAIAELHRRGSPAMLALAQVLARSNGSRRRALGMAIAAQLSGQSARGDHEAAPFALDETRALLQAGLDDARVAVLEAAAAGLGHRPHPAALPRLLELAAHPDARVRFAVAYALPSHESAEAVAALLDLAADRADDVRDWATFGLGSQMDADNDSIRDLLWTNAHDPDRDVRGEALVGLARRQDPRAVGLLTTRISSKDDCRVYELEAAQEMHDARLAAPLRALHDEVASQPDTDRYWLRCLEAALAACAAD